MSEAESQQDADGEFKRRVMIVNKRGLHARAAATDCHIDITTNGPQAEAAMAALVKLVADRFDEE